MSAERVVKFQFELRLTGGKILFLLAAAFMALNPLYLGSETLAITTYYPASGVYDILRAKDYLDAGRDKDITSPTSEAYIRIGNLDVGGSDHTYGIEARHGALTLKSANDAVVFRIDQKVTTLQRKEWN